MVLKFDELKNYNHANLCEAIIQACGAEYDDIYVHSGAASRRPSVSETTVFCNKKPLS